MHQFQKKWIDAAAAQISRNRKSDRLNPLASALTDINSTTCLQVVFEVGDGLEVQSVFDDDVEESWLPCFLSQRLTQQTIWTTIQRTNLET